MLSGPDLEELKTVRKGLKRCLKIARVLCLEREYLRFISPNMEIFKRNSAQSFLTGLRRKRKRTMLPNGSIMSDSEEEEKSEELPEMVSSSNVD